MEAGLQLAKSGHSSLGINHPMMKPWHWHYDEVLLSQVSTFEVCCDPTWSTSPKATEDALMVLNEMWNCGQRITAIGGSDSHLEPHERNPKATEPSIYGDPSTFVYSHGLSGEGILAGLRNGQVYLERRCGLKFDINLGDLLPGEDSKGQALTYRLSVRDTEHDYYAECVVDGKVIEKSTSRMKSKAFSLKRAITGVVSIFDEVHRLNMAQHHQKTVNLKAVSTLSLMAHNHNLTNL